MPLMWDIAVKTTTTVAMAGISAAYYALIRKNVQLEDMAMANVVADAIREENKEKEMNESASGSSSGDVVGTIENKIPTTTSQNIMRKTFELLAKDSGTVYGINLAHTNGMLAEKNLSESELVSENIINRAEEFYASQSTSAILRPLRRSQSELDIRKSKFHCQEARDEEENFMYDPEDSKSVFGVETLSQLEFSEESFSKQNNNLSENYKVCQCKRSVSAIEIPECYSSKAEKQRNGAECEQVTRDIQRKKSPTVFFTNPRYGRSPTEKNLQCSLLSQDYIPRLESRSFGSYNQFKSQTTIKKSKAKSQYNKNTACEYIYSPVKKMKTSEAFDVPLQQENDDRQGAFSEKEISDSRCEHSARPDHELNSDVVKVRKVYSELFLKKESELSIGGRHFNYAATFISKEQLKIGLGKISNNFKPQRFNLLTGEAFGQSSEEFVAKKTFNCARIEDYPLVCQTDVSTTETVFVPAPPVGSSMFGLAAADDSVVFGENVIPGVRETFLESESSETLPSLAPVGVFNSRWNELRNRFAVSVASVATEFYKSIQDIVDYFPVDNVFLIIVVTIALGIFVAFLMRFVFIFSMETS